MRHHPPAPRGRHRLERTQDHALTMWLYMGSIVVAAVALAWLLWW